MTNEEILAKAALDSLINKSRIHLYKPIQIAEILFYDRHNPQQIKLNQIATYRTISKHWRDKITLRLVGNISTSNSRYQDDLFNDHAIPPSALEILGRINRTHNGIVENYIYHRFKQRQSDVVEAFRYVQTANVNTFNLEAFLALFESRAGLRRSIDKAFEIVTYALFSSIIDFLDVWITVKINNHDSRIMSDFGDFISILFGQIELDEIIQFKAQLFRNGVTNAADRGLDIWANFGPAVQVKHISLNQDVAERISANVRAENIIVVCKTADEIIIRTIVNQLGWRIRGIVTQSDLGHWYNLCLNQYADTIGQQLLTFILFEFRQEFSYIDELDTFLQERNYHENQLAGEWEIL